MNVVNDRDRGVALRVLAKYFNAGKRLHFGVILEVIHKVSEFDGSTNKYVDPRLEVRVVELEQIIGNPPPIDVLNAEMDKHAFLFDKLLCIWACIGRPEVVEALSHR